MGTTYLHAVASLDGNIADERDDVGPLHDWYFNGDHPLVDDDHADVHSSSAETQLTVKSAWPFRTRRRHHRGERDHGDSGVSGTS
jgi:hypothetical protein